jgi:Fur family transcriptional regulator, ferric uptake regulator
MVPNHRLRLLPGDRRIGNKHTMAETDAQSLKTLLRSLGLRSTGARIAVIRKLTSAAKPMTHAEVSSSLESVGFDSATIFRNLNDLAEAGLVVRSDLGDHVWRFELKGDGKNNHREAHPHFVCTDCGTISCLPQDAVSLKRSRGTPGALRGKSLAVQIQGLCDACTDS